MSKYEFIDSQKAEPANLNSVVKMCRWFAVSTSGFYHWATRPPPATSGRRQALTARIQHYFEESDGTYGYRRIHADLAAERTECSPELVRQIMRYQGLVACQPRPFRITTEADAEAAAGMPDLVQRDFTADRPGVKFVGASPPSTPGRGSSTSSPSSTATRRKSSPGPSPITCAPSPMRSRTPPPRPGSSRPRSGTPIGAASTPRPISGPWWPAWACAPRRDAPACAGTTAWPNALDPELVGEVLSVIQKIAQQGTTMVTVTHEMQFARDIADRIVVMDQGIIVEEGPPSRIFTSPQHPKTRALLSRSGILAA